MSPLFHRPGNSSTEKGSDLLRGHTGNLAEAALKEGAGGPRWSRVGRDLWPVVPTFVQSGSLPSVCPQGA